MAGFSAHLDVSEVRRLGVQLETVGGSVGAQSAIVVRKTARDVRIAAKAGCPVLNGDLRDSISISFTGDGRFASFSAEVGPTEPYGKYVEDGTSFMAPEPFMGPAFDQHSGSLEDGLARAGVAGL